MNFKTWILKYKTINSPIGDLAREISSDTKFPNSKDHKVLIEYLNGTNIPDKGIKVFEDAYKEYLKSNPQ